MNKQEFVQQAYAAAVQSAKQSGMPALVTVAQAALESKWGESALSKKANNYFGIKAHGDQNRIQMNTNECENGARVVIKAEFAKYPSMLDCFQRRDLIIAKSPIYRDARERLEDESGFIREIAKHWATDPNYAEKLLTVLGEVKGLVK